MGLVETVRAGLDDGRCLVGGGLEKEGCRVSLDGAPQRRLIVDFDKPGSPRDPDETRCDYLFIAEDDAEDDAKRDAKRDAARTDGNATPEGWVVPLELKRGRLHARKVARQLQAGAAVAERLERLGKGRLHAARKAARQLQAGAAVAERLVPPDKAVRFRPVAVTGGVRKAERDKLKKPANFVRFRGRLKPVRLMKCGAPLVSVLAAKCKERK